MAKVEVMGRDIFLVVLSPHTLAQIFSTVFRPHLSLF